MHTALKGAQYNKIIDLLKKELSGKAWWSLNDPEMDRHIFFLFYHLQCKKGRMLDYFKINGRFWTAVLKFFDLSRLYKHGSSYRG